jgi:hypothetical protein
MELSNYIVNSKGEIEYSFFYQELNKAQERFLKELELIIAEFLNGN